jgi:hypothetical protein
MKKINHYSGVPIEEIEKDPVYYCKSCLSLGIIASHGDHDSYCKDCGGAVIGKTNITFWVDSYRLKYGKDHLTGLDIPYNEECKHCALKK